MEALWGTRVWIYLRRHRLAVWAVIVVAAGAVTTAAVAHAPVTPGDWAAWAQAIGSIVALGIAVWIPHAASHTLTVKADSAAMVLTEQLWTTLCQLEELCHTEEREKLITLASRLKALRALSHQIRIDAISVPIMDDFVSIVGLVEEADVHAELARNSATNLHHLATLFEADRQKCGDLLHQMKVSGIEWHLS